MEPVIQPDYVDGRVVHVGAGDGLIPVHLGENGTIRECTANAEMAGRLRPFLNGPVIRVFGTAGWMRDEEGVWKLQQFSIEQFMELEDRTLAEAVAQLEHVASPRWPRNAFGDLQFGSKDEKNRSH